MCGMGSWACLLGLLVGWPLARWTLRRPIEKEQTWKRSPSHCQLDFRVWGGPLSRQLCEPAR